MDTAESFYEIYFNIEIFLYSSLKMFSSKAVVIALAIIALSCCLMEVSHGLPAIGHYYGKRFGEFFKLWI